MLNGNTSPTFSIVIPTYNRQAFILNTLESVWAQTYENFEVIVVDNASTDNTVELLRPLVKCGKIRLIEHPENYERARSRNTGMESARGDFLTFLDSDDFMYPDNLMDAVAFANDNPTIRCFHNLYELVGADRNVIYKYRFPDLTNRLAAIVAGNFMSCIGNFIARDVYLNYKFDTTPDLTGGEDWDFWLRVIADHDVGRIEKCNSGILHHSARTVTNQNIGAMERGLRYMVEKFRQDQHLSVIYRRYLDRIESNCYLYMNLLANDGRLTGAAFSYLLESIKSDKRVVFSRRFLQSLRRTLIG